MELADDAEDVGFVDDEDFLAVDFDFGAAVFGDEDFVALLDGELDDLAVVILPPVPRPTTSASWGFSLAVSGRTMPPALFSSASRRFTRTRWPSGLMLVP